MAVSDYSTTAASNTSISGINIAEGMAPSDVNNAMRQMMADIASWRATFDTTGNTTLGDAGTDTTTINGTAAIQNTSGSADASITLYRAQTGAGVGIGRISFDAQNASAARVTYGYTQMEMAATTAGAHTGRFTWVGYNAGTGSQWMALDSGNLLVGASSAVVSERLSVVNTGSTRAAYLKSDSANTATVVVHNAAGAGDNSFIGFNTESAGTGTARGSISYNRGSGVVAYNTTSDRRAKTLHSRFTSAGTLIDAIPVHLATMHDATVARPMFVADELQDGGAAFAVTGDRDAEDDSGAPIFQQVDASVLVPVLWAEVQSLRARVAQLEAQ